MKRGLATVAALALLLAGLASAQADERPTAQHHTNSAAPLYECGPKTIGQLGCQAGVRCKCRYDAFGSAMTGMPPGYRWDCGLEQGSCMADVPATIGGSASAPSTVVVPYHAGGQRRASPPKP
jgi:hypothetical protein